MERDGSLILKTIREAVRLILGFAAGLAVLLGLLAWRLSSGPISLAILTPHFESALNEVLAPLTVGFDDTILTWAGWERSLDIRVVNVRLEAPGDQPVLQMPELALSLSAEALLHGQIAPKRIELFKPHLRIVHRSDGNFGVGFRREGATGDDVSIAVFDRLLAGSQKGDALQYLTSVDIVDATLTIDDLILDTSWETSSVQVKAHRDPDGIRAETSLRPQSMGRGASVTVVGEYRNGAAEIDVGIAFGGINPARLSAISSQLAQFAAVDAPVSGELALTVSTAGVVEAVGFEVEAGAGHFDLPAPLSQRLAVAGVALKGRFDSASSVAEVERLSLDFGEQGTIRLDPDAAPETPLRSIVANGRYDFAQNRLEISRFEADLGGPKAELEATVDGVGGPMSIVLKGSLAGVSGSDLRSYWPEAWGRNPQAWSVEHISAGLVEAADIRLSMTAHPDGSFEVAELDGNMRLKDITVAYLPPLPPLRGAAGSARFDRKRFDIVIDKGASAGIALRGATIAFTGLDQVDQFADVDLRIEGPLRAALELIESPPLGFASAIGLDPSQADGVLAGRLKLHFIVEKALTQDQVKAEGTANLRDVAIRGAAFGIDLTRGNFDLSADNRGLSLGGSARLGSIDGKVTWRQAFEPRASFRSQYGFAGRITPEQRRDELKLDFPLFSGGFWEGPFGADIKLTAYDDKRRRLEGKIDLTDSVLDLDDIGWGKAPGVSGSAEFDALFEGTVPKAISRLTLDAGTLAAAGSGHFSADGTRLAGFVVDYFRYPGTDLAATVTGRADGGWDADINGRSFNLEPILRALNRKEEEKTAKGPTLNLSANISRIELGGDRVLHDLSAALAHDGLRWTTMLARAQLEPGQNFSLQLEPADGKRHLTIRSNDAGETLRRFDYYENMQGGALDLSADYDDRSPGSPLAGRLTIRDYRLRNAPILARLVSVLALTGIPEALRGGGLGFRELQAPFRVHDGLIEVKDAKATAVSLGFTASGEIDTRAGTVDIEGTAIPAYLLNSILGGIPLIGSIFSGGESGGGVFAANYAIAGKIDDPKVTVNPLAALAPGILRRLFDVFGAGQPLDAPPGAEDR